MSGQNGKKTQTLKEEPLAVDDYTRPTNNFIRALVHNGYKVKISHRRRPIVRQTEKGRLVTGPECMSKPQLWEAQFDPNRTDQVGGVSSTGGLTIVNISIPDTDVSCVGTAKCSTKDVFVKRIGLDVAFARAFDQLLKAEQDAYVKEKEGDFAGPRA